MDKERLKSVDGFPSTLQNTAANQYSMEKSEPSATSEQDFWEGQFPFRKKGDDVEPQFINGQISTNLLPSPHTKSQEYEGDENEQESSEEH